MNNIPDRAETIFYVTLSAAFILATIVLGSAAISSILFPP